MFTINPTLYIEIVYCASIVSAYGEFAQWLPNTNTLIQRVRYAMTYAQRRPTLCAYEIFIYPHIELKTERRTVSRRWQFSSAHIHRDIWHEIPIPTVCKKNIKRQQLSHDIPCNKPIELTQGVAKPAVQAVCYYFKIMESKM